MVRVFISSISAAPWCGYTTVSPTLKTMWRYPLSRPPEYHADARRQKGRERCLCRSAPCESPEAPHLGLDRRGCGVQCGCLRWGRWGRAATVVTTVGTAPSPPPEED